MSLPDPSRALARAACRGLLALVVGATPGPLVADEPLVLLAQPGPWTAVSAIIGYRGRVWFANATKFVNHNSADLYSLEPATGEVRYEQHLFSQDAGEPTVHRGLLYWPFEDARFSTGHGEFMVTNGRDWAWDVLPGDRVFHTHAMSSTGAALHAVTSAWHTGVQRSLDDGASWETVHEFSAPGGRVSRFTELVADAGGVYAGLTSWRTPGVKLVRIDRGGAHEVTGWPEGLSTSAMALHAGALYARNDTADGARVWRTRVGGAEPVGALDGRGVRALASGGDALWAVSAGDGNGALWRSADGETWTLAQRFEGAEPVDVAAYEGRIYVGTVGPDGRGGLWGPRPTGRAVDPVPLPPLPDLSAPVADAGPLLAELDRALAGGADFRAYRSALFAALLPLARTRSPAVGRALSERLAGPFADGAMRAFGGSYSLSLARASRWYLLWGVAMNGHGRIDPGLLQRGFEEQPNGAEKYFAPPPGAAWAAARLGQGDAVTLAALVGGIESNGLPDWVRADYAGALSAITGHRHGLDEAAWRRWWRARP